MSADYKPVYKMVWLVELLVERQKLLKKLASVLRRVGASHPKRAAVNAARATKRKALRRELRTLEAKIVAELAKEIDP